MNQEKHFRCLESMYKAGPINQFYNPIMEVKKGKAIIEINIAEKFHHSAGAVHGSVYFKMLDDAAFFAANSIENKVLVLTVSFTTYLTRPVSSGKLRSIGCVVNQNKTQFIAESVLYDSQDIEIGRGNGIFVKSKSLLKDADGYKL